MGAWIDLRGELATATDRNFERLVLPLLRIFWPELVRPPEKDHLDRAGIDLVVPIDRGPFPCVVQCKGLYSNAELTESHRTQIRHSVDAFLESDYSCDEYILLHNRTSANREVARSIEADLARIVSAGKAKNFRLWDRQTFVRDLEERLYVVVADRLRQHSRQTLDEMSRLFKFGDVYVSNVPVAENLIELKRGLIPKIEHVHGAAAHPVAKLVLSPTHYRWTLLTGMFGSGKSSAALHAAAHANRTVIFSRCAEFGPDRGGFGTNLLLEKIIRSLRLFDDFDDEGRQRLERLASLSLNSALRKKDASEILIIDGLDENRNFSSPSGMSILASVLAELRCPIILTTRQEHFDATFGNFDYALDDFSNRLPSRKGRIFELQEWGDLQVTEFIEQTIGHAHPDEKERLQNLRHLYETGHALPWPREIFRHPLFLQIIVELWATGSAGGKTRSEMIQEWVECKIARDLQVDRLTPGSVIDRTAFIHQMVLLMEEIAGKMVDKTEHVMEVVELIGSDEVVSVAKRVLDARQIDISQLVGVTLLLPTSQRRKNNVPMRFSHRAFQEYFLARDLIRREQSPEKYPLSVKEFYAEMVAAV